MGTRDPQLLDPARGLFEAVMQDIRDSDDSADAQTIVFLALQGLFFLDMMNLSPLSQAEAKQAHVTMEKMLNGAAS